MNKVHGASLIKCGQKIKYTFLKHFCEKNTYYKKIGPGWGTGMVILEQPFESDFLLWLAKTSVDHYFPFENEAMMYPYAIRFADEDYDKMSIYATDLKTYVEQMQAKFIVGEESFDKWDDYLTSLGKMKKDEFVEILQKYYDEFNR